MNAFSSRLSPREQQTAFVLRLERRGTVGDEGRADLRDTVGKRELEVGSKELLDVGAADILSLRDLNHTENLQWT